MLFLHNSLNSNKFANDKKLALLRKGIITIGQFANLIEQTDKYIMIGPAIVDKTKIKEFIEEWKNRQIDAESLISKRAKLITQLDVI
jgi:glycerol-3-phosphate responsive antiterminator